MQKIKNFFSYKVLLFTLLFPLIKTQAQQYVEIPELSSRNLIFKQYQEEIEENNTAFFNDRDSQMSFYTYTCVKKDTLFTVSSRCMLRQETLATANGIIDAKQNIEGKSLILPTINGLFISQSPSNSLEVLLRSEYNQSITSRTPSYTINGQKYWFLEGKRMSPSSRAFFLISGMRLPLEEAVVTSSYGMRISPISGKWKKHEGIDLAAPVGSHVFSCKNGIVTKAVTNDEVYGSYIVVSHDYSLETLYAHLSKIDVTEGQVVSGGEKIGEVGLTGLTTGPHLHFEIHNGGKSRDPSDYLHQLKNTEKD
ncbi:M23 family metallopeptidase [Treponema sp.]|uniref:M23 family metallopeptidase n=1 Tax=Treponema sp. TaxID=166 RepID=UPI0025D7DC01|nr:M23 family metallopeptidase [Treponema sp.]MCR5218822.1 M23 family metallopeptidase [Treponema sp.]